MYSFSYRRVTIIQKCTKALKLNSSHAEPKITCCTQCQYLQNRNCAEMSKIAARLKIGTHLPFQFS